MLSRRFCKTVARARARDDPVTAYARAVTEGQVPSRTTVGSPSSRRPTSTTTGPIRRSGARRIRASASRSRRMNALALGLLAGGALRSRPSLRWASRPRRQRAPTKWPTLQDRLRSAVAQGGQFRPSGQNWPLKQVADGSFVHPTRSAILRWLTPEPMRLCAGATGLALKVVDDAPSGQPRQERPQSKYSRHRAE
jgi:hypothetical protein